MSGTRTDHLLLRAIRGEEVGTLITRLDGWEKD